MAELEGKLHNIGGLFLLITYSILATFKRFLARTFRKVWSTRTLKNFCHSSYIFRIITHLLMDKRLPELVFKHTPKYYY